LQNLLPKYSQQTEKILGKSFDPFLKKFHLKIAKFQILPILWRGDFFAIMNANNF